MDVAVPTPAPDLHSVLRRYWGYDSFRPRQEEIVRSLLADRDVCVVMPTGGGKSLCYQLPAVVGSRTVVVVSPLIALMQDQVTQLGQMGIPAALLNSSLSKAEQSAVMLRATRGEYRLLYLSPERLASRADTFDWLRSIPLAFFAIDEAHCISEWGHEFRPDYRQLKALREAFPAVPIAAFTASATRRVRSDILEQLRLRDPFKHVASFHRANLRYAVRQCSGYGEQFELLHQVLARHAGENVILYAPTIKRVEELTAALADRGIAAVSYHGKMDAATRRQNQERWMSDEVRILVGTIAFGLGINKAAVRAVVHLSLPKSLEQYYQEAGRAGRDGLPADCILLWQARDAGLLSHFISQIEDAAERERSWQRYHDIHNFAQSRECRQRQICHHFGEAPKWKQCGSCDICTGATLATAIPAAPARSKRGRSPAFVFANEKPAAPLSDADIALREYMRNWRREIARSHNVPAFVVMYDTTLDALCAARPATPAELRRVPGFGDRKVEVYGAEILRALRSYGQGMPAPSAKRFRAPLSKAAREMRLLLAQHPSIEKVAELRGCRPAAVVNLVAQMIESGDMSFDERWIPAAQQKLIEQACRRLGMEQLRPIKDALPADISYDQIRLVAAHLRRQQTKPLKL